MAKNVNYVCDGCNAVLHGKDKAAFVSKDNIQINGQVVMSTVDVESGYKQLIFITKTKEDRLSFCDLVCFQDFVEARKKSYLDYKEKQLRGEAGAEHDGRLRDGTYDRERKY